MTAWQRGKITRREEKGLGSISFRRLLIAGGVGGLVAMAFGGGGGFALAAGGGGFAFAALILLTAPVDGMTAGERLLRMGHGRLLSAYSRGEWRLPAKLMELLNLDEDSGTLEFVGDSHPDVLPEYAPACTYEELLEETHA